MNMRLDYRISCLLSIFRREFDESSPGITAAMTTPSGSQSTTPGTNFGIGEPSLIPSSSSSSARQAPVPVEKRIDLETISSKAESIFDNTAGRRRRDKAKAAAALQATGPQQQELQQLTEQQTQMDDEDDPAVDLDLDGQGGKTFLRVLLLLTMHDSPPLVSGALRLLFRHFSQRQEVLQAFKQVQLLVSDSDVESYKQIKTDLDALRLLVEKSELWVYKAKMATGNDQDANGGGGDPLANGSKDDDGSLPANPTASSSSSRAMKKEDTFDLDDDILPHENNNNNNTSPTLSSKNMLLTARGGRGIDKLMIGGKSTAPMLSVTDKQGSAIDLDIGPPLEESQAFNYKQIQQILMRMNRLCVHQISTAAAAAAAAIAASQAAAAGLATTSPSSVTPGVVLRPRKHEQRLLRNMGVHTVVLDLLQIPYDRKEDVRMNELMRLAHEFLQNFCRGNQPNQALLHKHLDLFLTPGLLEAQTCCAIFQDNAQLCGEISEKVVNHFAHCVETHGRHVEYLYFLQTIVRAEGQFIRKCQDMVMQEVSFFPTFHFSLLIK